jgi:chemotaxis protein methyltransferase CheR
VPVASLAFPALSQAALERLARRVYEASGIRLGDTQRPLLQSRLQARLQALGLTSPEEYERRLAAGSGEMDRLLDLLAVHESYFFREISQLEVAVRHLIPAIRRLRPREAVRVLSAGCSAGEEPYSLAMLLEEQEPGEGRGAAGGEGARSCDILGTDLSLSCLDRARRGVYSAAALRDTTQARRQRFFEAAEGEWCLRDDVRRRVRFLRANLYRDPERALMGRFDLILCRNVLLYFDAPARVRVVAMLHDRLRAGGYLIVGRAETLINVPSPLAALEIDGEAVYQREGASAP